MRKALVAVALVLTGVGGFAAVASADQPGPGYKQCIPGQQGNPHPGFKAGVCDNP